MGKHFVRWIITALAVMMVPHIIGGIHVDSPVTALTVALVLGLLNTVLRPILIFVTLPFTVLSLGFFILIINAFLFWLTSLWVKGFEIESFGTAFLASVFVSVVSWFLSLSFGRENGRVRWRVQTGASDKTIDLDRDQQGRWR